MFGSPSTKFEPIPCEVPINRRAELQGYSSVLAFRRFRLLAIPLFTEDCVFQPLCRTARPLCDFHVTGAPLVCTYIE